MLFSKLRDTYANVNIVAGNFSGFKLSLFSANFLNSTSLGLLKGKGFCCFSAV
jgi:hypothetical protein